VPAVIVGGLGLACLGGLIGWAPDLISPRALIKISDDGFEQRVVHPYVFLPWAEVGAVSVVSRGRTRTIAVKVRDPHVLPRRWFVINKTLGNRWWGRAMKLCLGALVLVVDMAAPWNLPKDLHDVVTTDTTLHDSFEIRMGGFPVNAGQLVQLLRERQRAAATRASDVGIVSHRPAKTRTSTRRRA
jgi:hypothetical protein